ncbi:putative serine esterase-domain-containing protein, partial [Baffinella frigidus]
MALDLAYLSRAVLQRDRSSRILPLLARSNVDKTKDGVSSGGWRLANEILSLVEANPSIRSISLVGNSLGGLYVRYAVALLSLPGAPWKMCGLDAADLITTACPHLGVKDFTFVPIPSMLYAAAPLIFGRTGDDLLLKPPGGAGPQRGGRTPLLEAMAISPLFLQGVRTFKRRRAYANLEGDFLVPFGTAAFHVVPNRPGPAPPPLVNARVTGHADAEANWWGLLEGSLSNAFVQNASPLNRAGSSPIECEMVLPPRDFPAPPVIDSAAARMAASLD